MLLPAIKKKNKKGVSAVIGYVLLITVSIAISVLVYRWLKTYVPKEGVECPDGTSIFIKETVYDCTAKTVTLTFKNSGRFSIDGYFIHASTDPNALATIDLSPYLVESESGIEEKISGNSIRFNSLENFLSPEESSNVQTHSFDLSAISGTISKIEIIPIRVQVEDNVKKIVSCSNEKTETALVCA